MRMQTILLVEDDALAAEMMASTLREAGYAVADVARTLAKALTVVRQQPVDLAILDVELHGSAGDGVAVAQAILEHQTIPLIYVTGHTDAVTLRRVRSTQPAAFLSKPFHPVDLTMQVALVLQASVPRTPAENLLPGCLLVFNNGQWINIRQSEVVYAQADGNYTKLFVFNRPKPLMVTNNLKNVVPQLTLPVFYHLSRSHVVNLHYLAGLKETQLLLTLSDNPRTDSQPVQIPAEARAALIRRLPLVQSR